MAETRLLPTFHSIVLDVHVFQTKVEFLAIQLLKAFKFKIEIVAVFISTRNCYRKIFVLVKF